MLGGGALCAEQSHSEDLFNTKDARAGNRYRSGHSDHTGHMEALTVSLGPSVFLLLDGGGGVGDE